MQKLKTALLGAALLGCAFATPVVAADAQTFGAVKLVAPAQAAQTVHFDVFLPLRHKDRLEALLQAQQDKHSPQYHKWLTPAQFAAQFGPDSATMKRVVGALQARGFQVKEYQRGVRATGTVDQVNRTFGVHLMNATSDIGGSYVMTNETFMMPAELASAGAKIWSFVPHVYHLFSHPVAKVDANKSDNRYSTTGPYWFDDLKQAYEYPSATAKDGNRAPLNGTGTIIAAMMWSDVLDSDVAAVAAHEHYAHFAKGGAPQPPLRRAIDGGAPFSFSNGGSAEASLDVQQEVFGAPGATTVLYNIPQPTFGDVIDGFFEIDNDNFVDVASFSFGACELEFTARYNGGQDYTGLLKAQHELFMQGNAQGITFLASSGDAAGRECPSVSAFTGGPRPHFVPSVSYPASDPSITAVGGTNLVTVSDGTLNSAYVDENAWEDPMKVKAVGLPRGFWGAGGGYSRVFSKPKYQDLVDTGSKNQRAVPDIGMMVGGCPFGAADFSRKTGLCDGGDDPKNGNGNTDRSSAVVAYGVGQGGGFFAFVGTSVSSPEFAGAVAHLVQLHGRQGNLNPYIYSLAQQQAVGTLRQPPYHTNIPGYNGVVETDLNNAYSLSTGVGTPRVIQFLGLRECAHSKSNGDCVPAAGIPQTRSNP